MGLLQRIQRQITQPVLSRVEPLEGTNMSLWNSIIPNWWTAEGMNDIGKMFWPADGRLADRVWITSRCLQMNSQQIGSMPVRFEAPNVAAGSASVEPAWVANPDPLYYPNGIGSLIKALVHDYYAWGWALIYITSRYADGYPRTFTRIPASRCTPRWSEEGYIEYNLAGELLDPADIIQIDRDCGYEYSPHGTSAISSYAQIAWGLLAAGNQAMEVNTGGIPKVSLKVTDENRKMKAEQAEALQTQWQVRTQQRGGAPPVLPYGLDFQALSFNPKDMALLETQDFNALALATAFGIPAVLINMTVGGGRGNSALTYQTPAMVGDQWWRYELRPTGKLFMDALSNQALPSGQWVWLDASDSLPPDNPQTGPFPKSEDDPQAAATAADQGADESGTAQASQPSGAPRLTVAGGNR